MKTYFSILFYVVLFVSFASLSSCQNSLTDAPQTDQYFPNRVGDRWTYAVSDSSGQVVDTLLVTVKRKTALPDGAEARVWQYVTSDSSYSRYVTQQADSVFFYSDSTAQHITEKIVTPYKKGAWWHSPTYGYYTSQKDMIKLVNGSTVQAYKIELGPKNEYGYEVNPRIRDFWTVSHLGIVKDNRYSFTKPGSPLKYQLLLQTYHLK